MLHVEASMPQAQNIAFVPAAASLSHTYLWPTLALDHNSLLA